MHLIDSRDLVTIVSSKLLRLADEYWNNRNSMTAYQFEKFLTDFTQLDECRFIGTDYEAEGILFSKTGNVLFVENVRDVCEHTRVVTVKTLFSKKLQTEKYFSISVETNKTDNYSLESFPVAWDSKVAELKKGDTIMAVGPINARVYQDHVYYSACGDFSCTKI